MAADQIPKTDDSDTADSDTADSDTSGEVEIEDIDNGGTGEGLVLDVGDPPSGTPYSEFEDFRAEALLRANGIGLSEDALVKTVLEGNGVLRAAASHALGSRQMTGSRDVLLRVAEDSDDLLRAEAAYALARLGENKGRALLSTCLERPVEAYLGAPTAAGFLAQLGDPTGFGVVRAALRQPNLIVRVVAAKQLFHFVALDGRPAPDGQPLDVYAELELALNDEHEDVAWLAEHQLREIGGPRAEALLDQAGRKA